MLSLQSRKYRCFGAVYYGEEDDFSLLVLKSFSHYFTCEISRRHNTDMPHFHIYIEFIKPVPYGFALDLFSNISGVSRLYPIDSSKIAHFNYIMGDHHGKEEIYK